MKRWIAKTLYPLAFWFARWCATNDHEIPAPEGGTYSYRITATNAQTIEDVVNSCGPDAKKMFLNGKRIK